MIDSSASTSNAERSENGMLSRMNIEYQKNLELKFATLRPYTEILLKVLSDPALFPDAIIETFRVKNPDRVAQKDVVDYNVEQSSINSKVTDIYAARMYPNPNNKYTIQQLDAKISQYVDTIKEYDFLGTDGRKISVDVQRKPKEINDFSLNIFYIIFNEHIELQILTHEDRERLKESHEQYKVDREDLSKCKLVLFRFHINFISCFMSRSSCYYDQCSKIFWTKK